MHKKKVINALDYQSLPMAEPPLESTPLPEFPTDMVESAPYMEQVPKSRNDFLFSEWVDPWPEIRKRLTIRQFEIFQYIYRFQMTVEDVMGVAGITSQGVHKILNAAKRRLQGKKRKSGKSR